MVNINEQRFLNNLFEQAKYGRLPIEEGGGLDRRSFSPADRKVREYFSKKAKEASLEVIVDPAANISARLPCAKPDATSLLIGSHIDTVANGGPYDGALGVWAALEVLCTVAENRISLPVHLEAIAFTDEEGRLSNLFGSRALAGNLTAQTIDLFIKNASDFPEDLKAMQAIVPGRLSVESVMSALRPPESIAGFLELHIEQGPQLEQAGVNIGVVNSIFGRRAMHIKFYGRSDHAGTTPLHLRADSLAAAAEFIVKAKQTVQEKFPDCVLTCGNIKVKHGSFNVVPAETNVWVEFRAPTDRLLEKIELTVSGLCEKITQLPDLSFAIQKFANLEPAVMDASVQSSIKTACKKLDYPYMAISSGALHDAKNMSAITPAGMIFVPSIKGRSHSPDEDTNIQDLIAGANVLLHTALLLARGF